MQNSMPIKQNQTKSNEAKQNDKPWLVVLFVVALLVNLLRAYTALVKNDDVAILVRAARRIDLRRIA